MDQSKKLKLWVLISLFFSLWFVFSTDNIYSEIWSDNLFAYVVFKTGDFAEGPIVIANKELKKYCGNTKVQYKLMDLNGKAFAVNKESLTLSFVNPGKNPLYEYIDGNSDEISLFNNKDRLTFKLEGIEDHPNFSDPPCDLKDKGISTGVITLIKVNGMELDAYLIKKWLTPKKKTPPRTGGTKRRRGGGATQ